VKIQSILCIFLLFVFLLYSSPVRAQQLSREWEAVRAIPTGAKVRVQTKDGKKTEGKLLRVADTMLTLERDGANPVDFNRDAIAKIYQFVAKSTGKTIAKSTLIGAGIGFGGGAGVGLAAGNYEDLDQGELVMILGGIGAAIGAGIGLLVGAIAGSGQKRVLVYESK
jgi:hypothetical protein